MEAWESPLEKVKSEMETLPKYLKGPT
jgi:hypothetical protein